MTKRANGEGSISQMPNGRWRVRVMIAGGRSGAYTATRKEAQAKYRELQGHADRGLLPPASKVTLAQHIGRWLEDEVRHTRKPRTYDSYRDNSRLHILPMLGDLKLAQIQPAHVQRLCTSLLEEGLAPDADSARYAVNSSGLMSWYAYVSSARISLRTE